MSDKNIEQNTELENKLKNEKRLEYANFVFIWIIRIIFIAAIVVSVVLRNVNTIIPSILGTLLVFLPVFIPRLTNFYIIPEFHLIFALFVFLAMFVGEIGLYYENCLVVGYTPSCILGISSRSGGFFTRIFSEQR